MRLPNTDSDSDGPNLTPVIDVVFLLLIFFLVATTFAQEERELSINLTEVSEAKPLATPPNELIINVTQEGKYKVGGRIYSERELGALLHHKAVANPTTQRVQLRIDEMTPFRFPATVISFCQRERLRHTCSVRLKRSS